MKQRKPRRMQEISRLTKDFLNAQPLQSAEPQAPFFSVITPSYNQAQFIRKNILSVLEQTDGLPHPDVEHIIADGGSRDGTVDVLKEFPHLKWVSERDSGQSEALNKGIRMATGKWIVWINSDDFLLPGALDKLRAFLEKTPDAEFIYSDCQFVNVSGRSTQVRKAFYHEDPSALYYWWRRGAGFGQPGSFFPKALWEKYGPFDESLHYTMDFDFWLKISDYVKFHYIPECLATYRLHDASKTLEGWKPFTREHMKVERRYMEAKGGWLKWKFRWLLELMYAKSLILEGLRCRDAGDKKRAKDNWMEAFFTHPLGFPLSRPFVYYVLQTITRVPLWKRLKEKIDKDDPTIA
ncbi:TPA: hypothetical protein DDW35_04550 [Candidatus Sumerlaeota bacterium]|nr:hypothetical protein [Candidatus Sumerlaeota bacterium]